jgi:hypothetical protein
MLHNIPIASPLLRPVVSVLHRFQQIPEPPDQQLIFQDCRNRSSGHQRTSDPLPRLVSSSFDFALRLFLYCGVTYVLRKMRAQDHIEGRSHLSGDDPRRAEMVVAPADRAGAAPNSGMADTLQEAKVALAMRYEEVMRRK